MKRRHVKRVYQVMFRFIRRLAKQALLFTVSSTIAGSAILGGQISIAAAPTEYQLKAAFLLNFAKFVDWPAGAFPSSTSPLVICVLGQDPFGKDLDDTVRGQSIAAKAFAVRRISHLPGDNSCQVVFVASSEESRFEQIIEATKALPILMVGEEGYFSRSGGMISFVVEDNKVRFEINLDSAERAGLKISSKLLRLAKTVHERRKS